MCDWCDYPDVSGTGIRCSTNHFREVSEYSTIGHFQVVSDQHFRDNIGKAVQILKDNLPK